MSVNQGRPLLATCLSVRETILQVCIALLLTIFAVPNDPMLAVPRMSISRVGVYRIAAAAVANMVQLEGVVDTTKLVGVGQGR